MTGKTHLVAGAAAAGWGLWLLTGTAFQPWWIALGALGGLLPDLDASESTIQNLDFRTSRYSPHIRLLKLPGLLINAIFGHRGLLHSLLALVLLILATALVRPPIEIIAAVGVGYLSHLVLDGLNPSGVPLFYPAKKRIKLSPWLKLKTGGLVDHLLFVILSLATVGLITLTIPQITK
jgi:inner membrane protein